ncbi:MAG: low temperature requirement protein A [Burkholderiales bacterium]|nr:low temperature requirement protein A [Anaerolineae bacterium]
MHETETRPRWIAPMKPRSPDETHRVSTPLELFFDLVFVVAVAQAAAGLHHGIAEGHTAEVLPTYLMMFFGIWWAWMNFTWFASSYDNDDIPYRLLVFVQMTGALILAAGVEPVFATGDLTITVIGYVVMRVAGVAQWFRASRSDPEHRPAAVRYAVGITLAQFAWIGLLFIPENLRVPGFIVLALVELIIPIWAEAASPTPWHAPHIKERYSLFTILVLGEAILSTSLAIQSAVDEGGMNAEITTIIIGALLIVYAMWWLYFYQPTYHLIMDLKVAFYWAYGHLIVFAVTAAVGAGLAVMVDYVTHHAEISAEAAGMAVALPCAIFVFSLWILQEHPRANNAIDTLLNPVTAFLILLTPFTGQPVLLTGILLAALVIIRLVRHLD